MIKKPHSIVTTEKIDSGIYAITFNHVDREHNFLDQPALAQFDEAISELIDLHDAHGVIIRSGKPGKFLGGIDMKALVLTTRYNRQKFEAFCLMGRSILAKLHHRDIVSVAAIDGLTSDAGLELAMWCDYRIATSDDTTAFELSQVRLGLLPAWGGLVLGPRIADPKKAIRWIIDGQRFDVREANEAGLIDSVVDKADLMTAAVKLLKQANEKPGTVRILREKKRSPLVNPVIDFGPWQTEINLHQKNVSLETVHPDVRHGALKHFQNSLSLNLEQAGQSEVACLTAEFGSPVNRGLLNDFFLRQRNRTAPGLVDLTLKPRQFKTVAIVGAGVMGRSIARLAIQHGLSVSLIDASSDALEHAATEFSDSAGHVQISASYDAIRDADLVIEAVVETATVKAKVHQAIESAANDEALLASNTSSIPIGTMAQSLERPGRFCGIHFCHPEVMSLVEIIAGPDSSEQSVADAVGFIRQLGKMPIAISDGAGFVVNRLLAAMLNQSLALLTGGLSVEEIDLAMCEFGFKAGPFQIIDIIGADTCMYAGRTMWEHQLSCVSLSPVLPKMVKLGRLGRKTLAGFYAYQHHHGPSISSPEVETIVAAYRGLDSGPGFSHLSRPQIAEHILSAVVLEASRIIEEEVVNDLRDIELAFTHGLSFPAFRGGILFWADEVGLANVVQILKRLAAQNPNMMPTEPLSKMVSEGRSFYRQ